MNREQLTSRNSNAAGEYGSGFYKDLAISRWNMRSNLDEDKIIMNISASFEKLKNEYLKGIGQGSELDWNTLAVCHNVIFKINKEVKNEN